MSDQTLPNSKGRSLWRDLLRWLVALAIVWFLGSRLAADWSAVRVALTELSVGWLIFGMLIGLAYIPFRVMAWQSLLRQLGVRTAWLTVAQVWVNGEIIRYIPGNVWSVVGRIAQFGRLSTTRSTVFASMVLEALVLVLAAIAVSALGLMTDSRFDSSWRLPVLGLTIIATLVFISRGPLNWLLRLIERFLRRTGQLGQIQQGFPAYGWMIFAWIAYALFQLFVMVAFGAVPNGGAAIALVGVFTLSWLVGYLSFLTPSGLGVREAVLVYLLQPYVDQSTALLIALISRVGMIILEIVTVAVINLKSRRQANVQTV